MLMMVLMAMLGASNVGLVESLRDTADGDYEIRSNIGAKYSEVVSVKPLSELLFKDTVRQAYDYSCGSGALTTVMNYFLGESLQENQVMEGMLAHGEKDKIVQRRGFSLLDMKRYVATLGYKSSGFKAEIQDLADLRQPGLVTIQYAGFKHFVTFRELRDGHVYIADPAMGKISFTVEHFAKLWDGNVLFLVYPKDGTEPENKLALSDEDLRVMDSDRIRQAMLAKMPFFGNALDGKVDAATGGVYHYKH